MRTLAAVVMAAACAATACEDGRRAEPAPAGALPPVAGQIIGPQPGPDRVLPTVDNPLGRDANVLREGRRLFVWYNCSGCHGGHAGGGMGPSLRDATWRYGHQDQDIFNSIAAGRSFGMPAWGTKLPVEEIWKLTAYIKSLGTGAEPSPPPQNPTYPDPPPRRDLPGREAGS